MALICLINAERREQAVIRTNSGTRPTIFLEKGQTLTVDDSVINPVDMEILVAMRDGVYPYQDQGRLVERVLEDMKGLYSLAYCHPDQVMSKEYFSIPREWYDWNLDQKVQHAMSRLDDQALWRIERHVGEYTERHKWLRGVKIEVKRSMIRSVEDA